MNKDFTQFETLPNSYKLKKRPLDFKLSRVSWKHQRL